MRILFLLLVLISSQASASADCPFYPKSEWLPEKDVKQRLADEGYTIKKFKVDGNCYEIYGHNKKGKKVEIYFDAKNLDIIKAEVVR